MKPDKGKEPCGGTALMVVTKKDFYYTVIRCIGIFMADYGSSLTTSVEVFWLAWFCIVCLLLSIIWDWRKSL